MTRDYEHLVDIAMGICGRCQKSTPEQRERHKLRVLHEIVAKQSRPAHRLPDDAWPLGRPWIDLPGVNR